MVRDSVYCERDSVVLPDNVVVVDVDTFALADERGNNGDT